MMNLFNTPLVAIIVTIGFVWLALCSHPYAAETGYKHSVFEVMPTTLKQRQANALQSLYNIPDDEIAKPVHLFGE